MFKPTSHAYKHPWVCKQTNTDVQRLAVASGLQQATVIKEGANWSAGELQGSVNEENLAVACYCK